MKIKLLMFFAVIHLRLDILMNCIMKTIYHISMTLGLCMEFMMMWGIVAVCGRDCPESCCLIICFRNYPVLKPPTIWELGKNDFETLGYLP
jgi:hypothetical protein